MASRPKIIIITIVTRHTHKRGTVWREEMGERKRERRGYWGENMIKVCYIYMKIA
jgi:hypothetical protein